MEVQGISLVARAILLAKQTQEISRVILSTDDDEIIKEAERAGCEVPFKRPADLSRSDTPMARVLEHAVEWIRNDIGKADKHFSGLVVLQPTSPMRKREHIEGAVRLYKEKARIRGKISGVTTVSPVPKEYFPDRLLKFKDKYSFPAEEETGNIIVNAGLKIGEQPYYRNGAAIVLDPDHITALNSFQPPMIPYMIKEQLVSVDSFLDLMKAEYCGRRLEPDPVNIDWSPRQKGLK